MDKCLNSHLNNEVGISLIYSCACLSKSCEKKDIQYLRFLLKQGFNFKCKCSVDSDNYSAIHSSRDIEVFTFLLENGFGVNDVCSNGMTPLHLVCYENNIELINFLLKKGADVNAETFKSTDSDIGLTPLLLSSISCNFEAIKILIENGAVINNYNGENSGLNKYYSKKSRSKVNEFIEGLISKNIKPCKR
jgi:ankyrin repeat protein